MAKTTIPDDALDGCIVILGTLLFGFLAAGGAWWEGQNPFAAGGGGMILAYILLNIFITN